VQIQNYQNVGLMVYLIGFAYADRHIRQNLPRRLWSSVFIAFLALTMASPLVIDWIKASLRYAHVQDNSSAPSVNLPNLERYYVRTDGLRFDPAGPDGLQGALETFDAMRGPNAQQQIFQSEYIFTLQDGAAMLRRNGVTGKSVFTFDFVNPFPLMFDLPRLPGGWSWIDPGRNMNKATGRPPETILGRADLVMVPKFPVSLNSTAVLQDLYGATLMQNFHRIDQTAYWTLFARNP
jgi:hypothetical protein